MTTKTVSLCESLMKSFVLIEHFQVWMRAAGLSKFKKLWGRIETELAAGSYIVRINNSILFLLWNGELQDEFSKPTM